MEKRKKASAPRIHFLKETRAVLRGQSSPVSEIAVRFGANTQQLPEEAILGATYVNYARSVIAWAYRDHAYFLALLNR